MKSKLPLLVIERETGVKRQSIMWFVRGERSLRLDMADKLAAYFGMTLARPPLPLPSTKSVRDSRKGKPVESKVDRDPAWWVFYVPGDEQYWGNPDYIESRSEGPVYWTCSSHTRKGDMALLYAKRPISAIVAVLAVMSDAGQDHAQVQFSSTESSWCDVVFEALLAEPLTFKEMREDHELRDAWGLVRGQFQSPGGRPPQIDDEVIGLLAARIPELKKLIKG